MQGNRSSSKNKLEDKTISDEQIQELIYYSIGDLIFLKYFLKEKELTLDTVKESDFESLKKEIIWRLAE